MTDCLWRKFDMKNKNDNNDIMYLDTIGNKHQAQHLNPIITLQNLQCSPQAKQSGHYYFAL